MVKKELTNKKVVRAIALGLSAVMLTTPMTAMASDNVTPQNDDDNKNIENQEQQSEVKGAASAANEAIDKATFATNTVKADVVNVEPGEAGFDTDDNDLAQDVIGAAADIENVESEDGASIADADTAVANADAQIDIAEGNAALAAGAVTQVAKEVADVETIVTDAKDIVDNAIGKVETETKNINDAATIEDANAAYEAAEAVVEKVKTDFEAKKAEYDTAKKEYEDAVAKVAEYEKAYNEAVAAAAGNAAKAAEELEAAKTVAADLESAVATAKAAVDNSAKDAMRIADAEKLTQTDNGLNWKNEDTLFIAIMEEYYLPELGIEGAKVTRVQGADNDSMNYFTAEYKDVDGNPQVAYYNYKMDGNSKDNIVIFEKREVEVNWEEASVKNPDYYKVGQDKITLEELQAGLNDGRFVAVVDENVTTYYEKKTATAEETLVEGTTITETSTTDVTVSDKTTKTYKIDETTGELVKEVTADVTTVTYTGKNFASDVDYATDAERDAAAQAKVDELNVAEGKDVEIVETQETTTTYVATGTYIPTFTDTVTVNNVEVENGWTVWDEADTEEDAVDYVYDEKLGDKYDDDEKYYIISESNNMSVTGMTNGKWNDDSDYLVSGSASVTYAKVTKMSVNKDSLGAIWDDITSWFGADSANEKIEAAVTRAIEAAGGIFVKADWADWDWNKATVYYVAGVAVEGSEASSEDDAKTSLGSAAAAQAKANGADGVYNVKSATEKIDTTTYSYEINYYEKADEKTESKVIAKETYANAETLKGQITQNLNYINGKILLNQNNEDYREFVDSAKDLTAKYKRLLDEANAADDAVKAAQEKVADLQKEIAAMEGAVNNEAKLAELAGQLTEAEKALADAQEDYDSLQDMMEKAAAALEVVVDALTPDPVDEDDDDEDDTTPVVPVATPVVLAEEPVAPIAVAAVTPAVGAGQAVVEIEDEDTPLAGGIGDAEDGEVIVAEAQEEEPAIVAIEDEETPLAAGVGAEGKMSWWWLLIVALFGAAGYKMYKDHQKKKEETQEA